MKTLHRPWPAGGLRRRYLTKEYFQRNLKSVDALCVHNSGEANHKVLLVDAKQDTVEAAAVLLGLGLTHPVELVSHPKDYHKPQPLKPLEDPTRAFITETLDADTQLSSSCSSPFL
ncbi:hypothetical protein PtB15_7B712 [Puccinia triticina]|nr:hypothetical protein PtB15_7B712 [Puccinia triticina]